MALWANLTEKSPSLSSCHNDTSFSSGIGIFLYVVPLDGAFWIIWENINLLFSIRLFTRQWRLSFSLNAKALCWRYSTQLLILIITLKERKGEIWEMYKMATRITISSRVWSMRILPEFVNFNNSTILSITASQTISDVNTAPGVGAWAWTLWQGATRSTRLHQSGDGAFRSACFKQRKARSQSRLPFWMEAARSYFPNKCKYI